MIPYIIIFLLVSIGFLYELSVKRNRRSYNYSLYLFIVTIVVLMTGFRDMIGGSDIYIVVILMMYH